MNQHPSPRAVSELKYLYHPFEIGCVGFSGSGKTTLIRKLINSWQGRYRVGYIKHSAHHLDLDRPGKDSELAAQAGACFRYMRSGSQQAFLDGTEFAEDWGLRFLRADCVVVEGGKSQKELPKLALVDKDQRLLGDLPQGVLALCGETYVSHALPWFHRDDIEGISAFVEQVWQAKIQVSRPLAVILSGGRSRRMGSDKGLLAYHAVDQVSYLWRLLESQGLEVVLSVRDGQYGESLWPGLSRCYDRFLDCGPLGAIASVQWQWPHRPILLLPCDRPQLQADHIRTLESKRHWSREAVVALDKGVRDPSCAIYEASLRPHVYQALERQNLRLQDLVDKMRVSLVHLDLGAHCNTPEERQNYSNPRTP